MPSTLWPRPLSCSIVVAPALARERRLRVCMRLIPLLQPFAGSRATHQHLGSPWRQRQARRAVVACARVLTHLQPRRTAVSQVRRARRGHSGSARASALGCGLERVRILARCCLKVARAEQRISLRLERIRLFKHRCHIGLT